jgi:N-acetylglucosaminyldiphosphoundecaprenol N-acetyl-beta-D-mannosaminyltransferase
MISNLDLAKILSRTSGQSLKKIVREVIENADNKVQNKIYVALHISMLNQLANRAYIETLHNSSLYIDGIAVAIVARKFGIRNIHLAPTTDLVPCILEAINKSDKSFRLGLIGGNKTLIQEVSAVLEKKYKAKVIFGVTGYPENWSNTERESIGKNVDLLLIGMGVPLESIFAQEEVGNFNAHTVMTCGGLFGFLAGKEKRAPHILRKFKMEWAWRLSQDPIRLGGRYMIGLINILRLLIKP